MNKSINNVKTKKPSENDYAEVRELMRIIQAENYNSYGYRRMTAALKTAGYPINHKVVVRLMREEGLTCKQPCKQATEAPEKSGASSKSFTTYTEGFGKKAPDLLKRNFEADAFGEKWVTDITRITINNTNDKDSITLYLSVVLDLYNTEILGYCISSEPKLSAVFETFNYAHMKHDSVHPIVHSDRGWFYCTDYYISLMNQFGYRRSMSETGSCLDNAVAESFFAALKNELIYPKKWNNVQELKREIHKYIKYYNNSRVKQSLGYQSPVNYRLAAS